MLYAILDISLLYEAPYKFFNLEGWEILEDTAETVRKNNDKSEFIISFSADNIPVIAEGVTHYTHKEILSFINNPANGWTEDED